MKKLIVLSSRFPYPLEKGDKLRLYHQLKSLSQHFEIHLLCITESDISQDHIKEVAQFCRSIECYKLSRPTQLLGLAINIFGKLPFQVKFFYDKNIAEKLVAKIASIEPDAIYCQLIRMAPYANSLKYPLIIDYMDAFSLIMSRQYHEESWFYKKWFYKLEASRLKRYEKSIQHYYQRKTIISRQDRSALDEISDLHVISNGVDINYFKPNLTEKKYDILFAGNMGYKPNIVAAQFLINEVVEDKSTRVYIAGARPAHAVVQLDVGNVTVSGWIKDMRDAYDQSRIFAAPIFQGAGQQNKILQAMAMGIPCVTTSQVNNAIGAKSGEEVLIADDVKTFRKQIKLLLNNDEHATIIAKNARKFIESKYSWEIQNDKLIALISQLTK